VTSRFQFVDLSPSIMAKTVNENNLVAVDQGTNQSSYHSA